MSDITSGKEASNAKAWTTGTAEARRWRRDLAAQRRAVACVRRGKRGQRVPARPVHVGGEGVSSRYSESLGPRWRLGGARGRVPLRRLGLPSRTVRGGLPAGRHG